MSGGGDCKLRIWRLPNDLPTRPSSSLTEPTPIDPPEKSRRPASYAFPIFTQTSLHSHHIDHVEWIGHDGHILTRTLCYNAPGKRVIRLFRPTFFDTLSSSSAKPQDIVGFGVDFPSKVELLARWTTPSCSGGIGDGVVCTANEIVSRQDGELTTRRRIYVPSIEPAVHIYDLDLKTKQPDLEALVHEYPFKLGDEMLFEEDKGKKGALKAVDCQTAGRGWLVAVGEGEKIMVWHRKESETWLKTQKDLRQLLWTLKLSDEKDPPSSQPVTNGAMDAPSPSMEQDTYESPADQATLGVNGAIYHQAENSEPLLANGHRAHDAGSATSDPAQSREDPVSEAIESKTFGDGHATSNPNGTAVDISTILRDDEDAPILDPTAMDPGRQGSLGRLSGTINGSTVHAESYEAEVDMYLRSPSVEYVAY